jgi:hypothetical protein
MYINQMPMGLPDNKKGERCSKHLSPLGMICLKVLKLTIKKQSYEKNPIFITGE